MSAALRKIEDPGPLNMLQGSAWARTISKSLNSRFQSSRALILKGLPLFPFAPPNPQAMDEYDRVIAVPCEISYLPFIQIDEPSFPARKPYCAAVP